LPVESDNRIKEYDGSIKRGKEKYYRPRYPSGLLYEVRTILNVVLLFLSFLIFVFAGDFAYRVHSRWFILSKETYNLIWCSGLGLFKILVLVFNFIPYIALLIIG
jgi:hypothetical protein